MAEAPSSTPVVGQLLDGRYQIVREIASGGMSVVYEAIHVKIGRVVAIKVLHREMAADAEVVGRFLNEARAVGTFGHPHIVASTDFGELPGHVPYLVLEYLEGHTLAEAVRTEGPLPVRRAARIAVQIASALEAAHARDVVHRDLTAANIFLVKKEGNPDHVKVLDFGISKFLSTTDTGPKTRRGLTMGTPEYMSPEQISDPDAVDSRVDVYALGVIMYLMLSGRLPFTRTPLQSLLTQIVMEPPPPIERHGIPEGLMAITLTALAKSPTDRFATMRDMSLELERLSARIFASGSGSLDVPLMESGALERPRPTPRPGTASGSSPRQAAVSGSISTRKPSTGEPTSAGAPVTDPMMGTRGGRGLLYAALVLALASVGGVVVLGLRSRRADERAGPAAPVVVAPAPPPPAPTPPTAPASVQIMLTSNTPAARVTLRGRTHSLPFTQELKAGSEPEVIELTAPDREGRRFWITLDHPIALAADLPVGRGVVDSTDEETVIALGGTPLPGGPVAVRAPSAEAQRRAGARKRPGEKPTAAASGRSVAGASSGAPAEPKTVAPESPAEPKNAPPTPAPKPEALPPPKVAAPSPTPEPAAAPPKAHATSQVPSASATPVARSPAANGLDAAKTQAVVKSHLPEVQRCYERGKMDDPDLKGRLTLRISVSVTGTVTSAMVESSSLHSSAVEGCVVGAVKTWRFPAPVGGPAVISYPFNLR